MADDDQALAAEPGFHNDPPQGGRAGLMSLRRFSDHRSEPLEQQPKNDLALAFGTAESLRLAMDDGAGSAAFQTTSGPVVEFMGGCLGRQ